MNEAGDKTTTRWIRLEIGEKFAALPEDWPQLPTPNSEPLIAFLARGIIAHPLVQALAARGITIGRKVPELVSVRPETLTLQWWEKTHPENLYASPAAPAFMDARAYYLKWAFWRLVVELFDRLRSGDWVMHGCRGDDPEQLSRLIPRVLWERADMIVNLAMAGGRFGPVAREGQPAPAMTYRDLTLHLAPTAADAPAANPGQNAGDAVITRTGAQGRPSSTANLVAPELARRAAAGEMLSTMKAEAEALSTWLAIKHPDQPQITPKSLLNALRRELRAAVNAAKQRGT